MLFHVHTNKGVFAISAPGPSAARCVVKKTHPELQIKKVKTAGGERAKAKAADESD